MSKNPAKIIEERIYSEKLKIGNIFVLKPANAPVYNIAGDGYDTLVETPNTDYWEKDIKATKEARPEFEKLIKSWAGEE